MSFFVPSGLQNFINHSHTMLFLFTPWVKTAYGELGQSEVAGAKANPRILNYFNVSKFWGTDD